MFNFEEALKMMPAQTVLCVGDLMLDEFVYGEVSRISPEAPAPVLKVSRSEVLVGGAGNVARNIAALGAPGAIDLTPLSRQTHVEWIAVHLERAAALASLGKIASLKELRLPEELRESAAAGALQAQRPDLRIEGTDALP